METYTKYGKTVLVLTHDQAEAMWTVAFVMATLIDWEGYLSLVYKAPGSHLGLASFGIPLPLRKN